jgi:hypothetical protein
MAKSSIASLPVRPFRGDQSLRQQYIERGKKFCEMTEIKHMYYDGLTLSHKEEVDSQVVIDFEEAFSRQDTRHLRPWVRSLMDPIYWPYKVYRSCDFDLCLGDNVHNDWYVDQKRNDDFISSHTPQSRSLLPSLALYPRSREEWQAIEQPITDDEFLIMSHWVFGFILRSRKWSMSPFVLFVILFLL